MSSINWRIALIGIVATLAMDVLSTIAFKLGLTAPLPPRLMGRWFASVAHGHPLHTDIALAPSVSHEMAIALPVHYAIGVTLTMCYAWITSALGWPVQSLGAAVAFGLATNAFPWFLMFPAMGYGFFGVREPSGTRLLRSSLVNHLCFGFGIWIGTALVGL